MSESYFMTGLMIAIIFGVPAGVIGALTIERTLSGGFLAGIFTGLGSSAADVVYASVGVFGIAILADFLTKYQQPISMIGSGVIICLGLSIFRKKPIVQNEVQQSEKTEIKGRRFLTCFLSSFGIAILNPSTFLSFMLAFSTFEVARNLSVGDGIWLIAGVLLGTCLWWVILSGGVMIFRKRITTNIYRVLNRCLGVLLVILGMVVLLNEK